MFNFRKSEPEPASNNYHDWSPELQEHLKKDEETFKNHQQALKDAEDAAKRGDMKSAQATRRALGD